MSTQQKQIRDAVASLLVTASGLPAGSIYRAPRYDLDAATMLPAILVYSHADKAVNPDDDHSQIHERIYTLRVEVRATGRPEEDATDTLSIAVRKAILTDDTLAHLANRCTWDQQQWDGVENQLAEAGSALDFNFFYFWRPEW